MKREIAIAWAEELRSGRYEQGRGNLNREGKLCCLGVLCEMAAQAGVNVKKLTRILGEVAYDGNAGGAPKSVMDWSGLKDCMGVYNIYHKSLAYMNDHGSTFPEIADVIEAEWKNL